ncbi:uncharacterized protein OCT59_017478 [Rhizophagus irregularis]|uniref:Uncharacterized protein n=1 Tax=Rhizophagus irregularis TaxID=588596 RepID=A0A915Z9T9_9GLOM|nr:hypothetical protein OCT59_017478 [Rhizophagus irregularis]GBC46328.1 hypothetical protein RIR_jg20417.t1 [Rhizophagus irregularis DAOM 181602=DAOM 197198]CAB4461702.1 unnamed protein product [Rhizophagus irregularis]CAB5142232.1 unnamed protein product [Rhizophagus irregularis]CAB5366377.1 unnamed protein product [Rhizophagus irregularis]
MNESMYQTSENISVWIVGGEQLKKIFRNLLPREVPSKMFYNASFAPNYKFLSNIKYILTLHNLQCNKNLKYNHLLNE